MQSNRNNTESKKPLVILKTKSFPELSVLDVGSKGFINAIIELEKISLKTDPDLTDRQYLTYRIRKANLINERTARQ